jgi:hypothetical protein
MSPYREAPQMPVQVPTTRKSKSWRRRVCFAVVIATIAPAAYQGLAREIDDPLLQAYGHMSWIPWLVPIGLIAAVIGALPVPDTDVKARLCRILWRRGDHGTAFGVYIGWIPLRLSQKRMDRNARAVRRFIAQRRREHFGGF